MTVGISELPPEGMQLGGVALAGDADRGTRTTEGLSLLFTVAGITVQGPQPQIERLLVWSGLDAATCDEKVVLPDGRDAAVMELTSGGQSIRFLLPTDAVSPGQAAYLDQALPAWLTRYRDTAIRSVASEHPQSAPPTGPAAPYGTGVQGGPAAQGTGVQGSPASPHGTGMPGGPASPTGPMAPTGPVTEPLVGSGVAPESTAGPEPALGHASPPAAAAGAAAAGAAAAGAAAAGAAAAGDAAGNAIAGARDAGPPPAAAPDVPPAASESPVPPLGGNRPAAAYTTTQSSTIPSPTPSSPGRPEPEVVPPPRPGPPPPVTAGSLLAPVPGEAPSPGPAEPPSAPESETAFPRATDHPADRSAPQPAAPAGPASQDVGAAARQTGDQPVWGAAPTRSPDQPVAQPAGQQFVQAPPPAGSQPAQQFAAADTSVEPQAQPFAPQPSQPAAQSQVPPWQHAASPEPPVQPGGPPHAGQPVVQPPPPQAGQPVQPPPQAGQPMPPPPPQARQPAPPPPQAGQPVQPPPPPLPGQAVQSGQPVQAEGPQIIAPAGPPPAGTVPTKKTRAWRRARPPAGTGPVPPPGALAAQPPSQPPKNPVPLTSTTLPPPPPEEPVTAGAVGATPGPGTADYEGEVPPLPGSLWRSRRRRRAVEVGAVGAVGAMGAGAVVEGVGNAPAPEAAPIGPNAATDTPQVTGFVGAPSAPAGPPPSAAPQTGWGDTAAPPAAAASSSVAPAPSFVPAPPSGGQPPGPADVGPPTTVLAPTPPGGFGPGSPLDEATLDAASEPDTLLPPPPTATAPERHRERNMPLVFVLVAVLAVVLGAIVFLAVRNHNSTTATTQPGVTSPSTVAVDSALATSINLRLSDLPTGWALATPAARMVRPPIAPAAAQIQANRALAGCLGVGVPTVAGLFGDSVLPGQTASVRSPTYALGADPNIQMFSATTILSTPAQVQNLGTPFDNPNFTNCYGLYQNALVSAAVPGATAQVQAVQLTAPVGVRSFGYLISVTIPGQGSEVVGQAFMLGGRIESRLQPSTNGPPVPSDSFAPAYDAMVGRISRALNN